jgi:hypothetical protein
MAKPGKTAVVCQSCGAVSPRWAGKCPACEEWNTLIEEATVVAPPGSGLGGRSEGRVIVLEKLKGVSREAPRFSTGIGELDRATGGGTVPGSALRIGGEPGIGKSTLLLQLAASVARMGRRAIYFSGEEAAAQVRLRTERRRIATIAAGYADGVFRHASASNEAHGGAVAIRGKLAPIVGRVSMDLITVDVTDVGEPAPAAGDWVDLVGPELSLEAVGTAAGTIGYEVLTRLGPRFHRIYRDATE